LWFSAFVAKKTYNMKIVWFKRDLRLHDHEAMHEALSASGKTLLLYIFEPSVLND
jgi:deoxyribodipyrimidine photo-lyase